LLKTHSSFALETLLGNEMPELKKGLSLIIRRALFLIKTAN